MLNNQPLRISTVTEYHRITGLPKPEHPLISVIDIGSIKTPPGGGLRNLVFDFYSISLKRGIKAKYKYGQQSYDFDEGVLFFMAPGQVFSFAIDREASQHPTGWMILIHPDFLWNTTLAKTIKQYEYFGYSVNEALYLSEKEESTITGITRNIQHEYHSSIDRFSHNIIISQLESLLNYAERFYQRQFLTRRAASHTIINKLEELLTVWFGGSDLSQKGLPTVGIIADMLNVSPDYLSALLKALTGLNTQQHIHQKLIEKAKEQLSTTALSVSEIAYQLGFEHPQSFSKLFKTKTSQSPIAFRHSFN